MSRRRHSLVVCALIMLGIALAVGVLGVNGWLPVPTPPSNDKPQEQVV